MPVGERVDIQPMGRGTTQACEGLDAEALSDKRDLNRYVVVGGLDRCLIFRCWSGILRRLLTLNGS